MNKILLTALFSSLIFLGACSSAQKASEVSSVRIPVAPYLKMDCKELATEMSSLSREAESSRSQVDSSYSSDKTKEAVAWILFAPAALFMDGNQQETGKLAALKGQIEAVQEAQKINKCSL
jgi:outer membrane murein-binding lipoprotein Lpp